MSGDTYEQCDTYERWYLQAVILTSSDTYGQCDTYKQWCSQAMIHDQIMEYDNNEI